jgi:hypothetical protein
MKSSQASNSGLWTAAAAMAVALSFALPVRAQDAEAHHPIVKDWISHHVIFSNPGTKEDAIKNGTYERWLKITNDPRYIMQQQERALMASHPSVAEPEGAAGESADDDGMPDLFVPDYAGELPWGLAKAVIAPPSDAAAAKLKKVPSKHKIKKDWSEGLTTLVGAAGASGATTGLGEFPGTYQAGSSPNCANDFAMYNTGLTGSPTQASIIAYYDLYSTCTGEPTGPSVYWAFNTAGTIVNSVAFWEVGTAPIQSTLVYFVQTNSSGYAQLVLLNWKAETSSSIGAPSSALTTAASNTAFYNSSSFCTAPCMFAATLSGNVPDTYSSPYYDPSTDTMYVGDDNGKLHKFTPVFKGALTEVTPVSVNTNASLGSPVYDSVSGNVFVGDYPMNFASACEPPTSSTPGSCGYLYAVGSGNAGTTYGTVTKSAQLDYNDGIIDSPIVDSTQERVYAFVGADSTTSCANSGPCAGVFQFSTSSGTPLTAGSPAESQVGAGYEFMMSGAFDNQYYNSSNGTGHLYVVGGTGPSNNTLYAITISSDTMTNPGTAGPTVGSNYTNGFYAAGMQVTEYLNGSTDYIFASVLAYGNVSGCTGGTGTVTTSSTTVTWVSGTQFVTDGAWVGLTITINGVAYVISSVSSATSLALTASAGTQTAVAFSVVVPVSVGCVFGFTAPNSGVIAASATANGVLPEEGGSSGIVVDYAGTSPVGNIYFSTLLNQGCTTPSATAGCAIQATQSAP